MDGAAATQPPQTAPVGRAATVAACGIVVVLTAGLRFLSTVSLSNDEYVSLAGAQQMLFGEWPTRDFLDTGGPLMYAASAASQLVFGRSDTVLPFRACLEGRPAVVWCAR